MMTTTSSSTTTIPQSDSSISAAHQGTSDQVVDFATAELYDTYLDRSRVVPGNVNGWKHYGGIRKFMGRAVTIKCFEDNSRLKELAFSKPPGAETLKEEEEKDKMNELPHVLVVDAGGSTRCAVLGDMIAQAAHDNGWKGIVIGGCVRDVAVLQTIPMGIYAMGSTPRKSTRLGEGQVHLTVRIDQALIHPNDIVFCDEDGILILDPEEYRESRDNKLEQE